MSHYLYIVHAGNRQRTGRLRLPKACNPIGGETSEPAPTDPRGDVPTLCLRGYRGRVSESDGFLGPDRVRMRFASWTQNLRAVASSDKSGCVSVPFLRLGLIPSNACRRGIRVKALKLAARSVNFVPELSTERPAEQEAGDLMTAWPRSGSAFHRFSAAPGLHFSSILNEFHFLRFYVFPGSTNENE
ncbi:hypothetical protein EYF80_060012 [Liparis tanakae]|uniref:Uncharacterized protein n=1 Tax=Liparis tanakae TaxID=230148 RepID=A0A4Z2EM64_9TELE|nr:hypothetical protein EYF80_060012 [Liparis tanakae]